MKVYNNVIQGSDEWKKLRIGKITGTKAKAICGIKRKKDGEITLTEGASTVIQEKIIELVLGGLKETYTTEAMQRGIDLEVESRSFYEFKKDCEIKEVGFIEVNKYSGFSPDGLIGEDGLFETKSLNAFDHLRVVLFDYIKPDYYYQCQKGLSDTNRQWCDFTVYNPDVEPELQFYTIRIFRNEEIISQIKESIEIAGELIESGYNKYLKLKNKEIII